MIVHLILYLSRGGVVMNWKLFWCTRLLLLSWFISPVKNLTQHMALKSINPNYWDGNSSNWGSFPRNFVCLLDYFFNNRMSINFGPTPAPLNQSVHLRANLNTRHPDAEASEKEESENPFNVPNLISLICISLNARRGAKENKTGPKRDTTGNTILCDRQGRQTIANSIDLPISMDSLSPS